MGQPARNEIEVWKGQKQTKYQIVKAHEDVPPHDEDSEVAILGAMIIEQKAHSIACDQLKAEDFYMEWNQVLFTALSAMNHPMDELTVRTQFRKNGILKQIGANSDFIGRLIESCPSAANVESYISEVLRTSRARKARNAAIKLHQTAESGDEQSAVRNALVELEAIEQSLVVQPDSANELNQQIEDEISGKRTALDCEYFHYMATTQCFLPGTITLFCGSPGASKSLWCLEALWRLYLGGVNVAALMLESGITMHLRRAMAQYAANSKLTSIKWVKENPELAREEFLKNKPFQDAILKNGVLQAPAPGQKIDGASLLRWMSQEADKGRRLLFIDPITMMDTGENWLHEEAIFFKGARAIVDRKQFSLLIVMHPKTEKSGKGQCTPSQDNIQGNPIFRKASDSIFWLEAHKMHPGKFQEQTSIMPGMETPETTDYNRTLHVLKARLGPGANRRIGYQMCGDSLRHIERGFIQG